MIFLALQRKKLLVRIAIPIPYDIIHIRIDIFTLCYVKTSLS